MFKHKEPLPAPLRDDPSSPLFNELWEQAGQISIPQPPELTLEWQKLEKRLNEIPAKSRKIFFPWSIAAIFLLVSSLVTGYFFMMSRPQIYETAQAQHQDITLPDNSLVNLNAESRLQIQFGFNQKHRRVHLEGEAFFDIQHADQPFIIETGEIITRVVGTRFNIKYRQQFYELSVISGLVTVQLPVHDDGIQQDTIIKVNPGELLKAGPEQFQLFSEAITGLQQAAWQEKRLFFFQTPLINVLQEIERQFSLAIKVTDSNLYREQISGLFNMENQQTLLESIALVLGCQYRQKDKTVTLSPAP